MKNYDLNRLKTAIAYAERMADGKNPVSNTPAAEEDIINNPNVIRCMFFIRDVLQQVYDNGGVVGGRPPREAKPERKPFPLEVLAKFSYRRDQGISNFVQQINEPLDQTVYAPLSRKVVSDWLEAQVYLIREPDEQGRRISRLTEKGKESGIYLQDRTYNDRTYTAIIYGKAMQEYIISQIPGMLSSDNRDNTPSEVSPSPEDIDVAYRNLKAAIEK